MDFSIEQALRKAIIAHRSRNIDEAAKIYGEILKVDRQHANANHNLGLIAFSRGKTEIALSLLKAALDEMPRAEQFRSSYIGALIETDQLHAVGQVILDGREQGVSEATLQKWESQISGDAVSKSPSFSDFARLHYTADERGRSKEKRREPTPKQSRLTGQQSIDPAQADLDRVLYLYQHGQYREAELSAKTLTEKFPKHPYGWKILGAALTRINKQAEALDAHYKAKELAPGDAEALNNLGLNLHELGRFREAKQIFDSVISLKQDSADGHFNLGVTLQNLGDLSGASEAYEKTIRLNPTHARAFNNLGNIQRTEGDIEDATASYRRAIDFDPNLADARLNYIDLLEKSNRYDDALAELNKAKDTGGTRHADFVYYEALLHFRKENYGAVDRLIDEVVEAEISSERKASYFHLKAKWSESKSDYTAAFQAFQEMNDSIKSSTQFNAENALKYLTAVKGRASELRAAGPYVKRIVPQKSKLTRLIFMVAFPRSGTTLLDSILRSHSRIEVVEEQPMVSELARSLSASAKLSDLESLTERAIENGRKLYFQELRKHTASCDVVIDKMPLNIVEAPLLSQIFPEAEFLLALRNPVDCILSCWMQNFGPNAAMANLVDLESAIDLYCASMEIFKASEARYSLRVHPTRYEDLVEDFGREVSTILNSLHLEWEPQVEDYRQTALSRNRIKTPSYSQVIKPIYRGATNRWKNYELILEQHLPKLRPWMIEFNYL